MPTELIEILLRLEQACFERPWSADQILGFLRNPGCLVYLEPAESEDPVAYALVQEHVEDALSEILRIGVLPGSRRGGLGRLLLARLDRNLSATKRGTDWKIMLEVSENNAEGRALYRAAGFQEIHRRRRYYPDGADALILERIVE